MESSKGCQGPACVSRVLTGLRANVSRLCDVLRQGPRTASVCRACRFNSCFPCVCQIERRPANTKTSSTTNSGRSDRLSFGFWLASRVSSPPAINSLAGGQSPSTLPKPEKTQVQRAFVVCCLPSISLVVSAAAGLLMNLPPPAVAVLATRALD